MDLIDKIKEGYATLILKKPLALNGKKKTKYSIYVLPQADGKNIHFYYSSQKEKREKTSLSIEYIKDLTYSNKKWKK